MPSTLKILPVQRIHSFHCLDPLFEVHKGVVFNLLHSFNSTESLKCFSKILLGYSSCQIPAVEDLHPGHGVVIRLILRVRPIHNDVTAPDFDSASSESPLGETCSLMTFIFKETESPVLLLVVGRRVDNDVNQAGCMLCELVQSSSRSRFLGMLPTKRRWLLNDIVTPSFLPFLSSKSFNCLTASNASSLVVKVMNA